MENILKTLKLDKKNSGSYCTESEWLTSNTSNEIISFNPTNEKPIASVYESTSEDYEKIISQSQKIFLEWRTIPAPKRAECIRLIGEALRKQKEALGMLVSLETGKSKQEGLGEVQEMIDMADFAVGQARLLSGHTLQSEREQHRLYEQWHPLGVVGIITAFNFPVAVWAWNAFLAVICGNTVVWKPSPKTPLCAVAIQHLCHDVMKSAGFPNVFSLFITQKISLIDRFIQDTRVPLISFTGSTSVGQKIQETVAKRLGKTLLELSGNNALIVDETADLKMAIPAIVFGAIGTAGQRCTTTRRLIVHEKIYDKLIDALIHAYQQIKIGDPLDEKNHMGPLIDADAVQHFLTTISQIQKAGGKILWGGKIIAGKGFFVEPTLVEAKNEWDVVQHETFAPILYIMKYHDLSDAIAMQNESRYGLSSSLFTNHLQHAELFLSESGSDCGLANINTGTAGAEIGGAFGGEKATGGGREAGSDAWKAYMRRQTNVINWGNQIPLAQGIQFNLE